MTTKYTAPNGNSTVNAVSIKAALTGNHSSNGRLDYKLTEPDDTTLVASSYAPLSDACKALGARARANRSTSRSSTPANDSVFVPGPSWLISFGLPSRGDALGLRVSPASSGPLSGALSSSLQLNGNHHVRYLPARQAAHCARQAFRSLSLVTSWHRGLRPRPFARPPSERQAQSCGHGRERGVASLPAVFDVLLERERRRISLSK